MIDIDDGTGPEEKDADLLEKDANARIEVVKKRQLGRYPISSLFIPSHDLRLLCFLAS